MLSPVIPLAGVHPGGGRQSSARRRRRGLAGRSPARRPHPPEHAALDLVRGHGDAVDRLETGGLAITPQLTERGCRERVRVYHGHLHTTAELTDFTALGELTTRLAELDLTSVDGPWWALRLDSPVHRAARRTAARPRRRPPRPRIRRGPRRSRAAKRHTPATRTTDRHRPSRSPHRHDPTTTVTEPAPLSGAHQRAALCKTTQKPPTPPVRWSRWASTVRPERPARPHREPPGCGDDRGLHRIGPSALCRLSRAGDGAACPGRGRTFTGA